MELPEPDLNDLDLISSYSKLINSNNLLNSKFASDQVVEINITKVGVDDWLVNGDMSFEYKDKNFNNFFIERFEKYVTSKINNLLNSNTIDTSQLDFAKLSIANIFSFDDYSNSRDLIKNLVGTKEISIDSFEIDKISYSINIYGDFKSYIREISDINFLKITDIEYSKNIIEIDLIR